MGAYLAVLGVYIYSSVVVLTALLAVVTGRSLPERWRTHDLVTVMLGSQKLSRTLSKDAVTSPIRAPFARYAGRGGPAEVQEETQLAYAMAQRAAEG